MTSLTRFFSKTANADKRLASLKFSMMAVAIFYLGVIALYSQFTPLKVFDFTAEQEFSIHPESTRLLSTIREPINLTLYFSERYSAEVPELRRYARKIHGLLAAFEKASGGMVQYKTVEPDLFTEEHEFMSSLGLQAVTTEQQKIPVYLGLYGVNSVDGYQVIPFLSPENSANIEYQLIELIYKLNQMVLPKLTIITDIDIDGGYSPLHNTHLTPWRFYSLLSQYYQISISPVKHGVIGESGPSDAILLIAPNGISQKTLARLEKSLAQNVPVIILDDPYFSWRENQLDPVKRMLAGPNITAQLNDALDSFYAGYGMNVNREMVLHPVIEQAWVELSQVFLAGDNFTDNYEPSELLGKVVYQSLEEQSTTKDLSRIAGQSVGSIEFVESAKTEDGQIGALLANPKGYELLSTQAFKKWQINSDQLSLFTAQETIAPVQNSASGVIWQGNSGEKLTIIADADWLDDRNFYQNGEYFSDNFTFLLRLLEQNKDFPLSMVRRSVGKLRQLNAQNEIAAGLERTYLSQVSLLLHREQQIEKQMQSGTGDNELGLIEPEQGERIAQYKTELIKLSQQQMQLTLDKHQPLIFWQNRIKIAFVVMLPLMMLGIVALVRRYRSYLAEQAVISILKHQNLQDKTDGARGE